MNNTEITHHGILGMKWGKRKNSSAFGSVVGRKKSSPDVKKMSDSELKQKINRLQMEKQYTQLTRKESSAGKKFVMNVLTDASKQTASKYVSKYMSQGVDALIKKAAKN